MDVDTLLTTTRSVRRKLDLDRPVEPEVITELPAHRDAGADRRRSYALAALGGRP
jgi:hypothetical protein